MKKILIEGGNTLIGRIDINGAKNSAVALLPASVLCDESTKIYNVPNISDRDVLIDILKVLDCNIRLDEDLVEIDASNAKSKRIPLDLSNNIYGCTFI